MAPDIKHEISGNGKDVDRKPATNGVDTSKAEAALKAKLSRKRTKSGCLTCRKRRIKCGEERPVCKNCIKSKRGCEGYNQRVVFKAPTYVDFRPAPHGGAHITFQAGPVPVPTVQYPPLPLAPYVVDGNGYTELRPRSVEQFVSQTEQPTQHQQQPVFMAPHQPQFAEQPMVPPHYAVQMPTQAPSDPAQAIPADHFAQAQLLASNYQAAIYGFNPAVQVPVVPQLAPAMQYQVPPHVAAGYDRVQQAGAPPPQVPTSNAQTWATPTPLPSTTTLQATPVSVAPTRKHTLSQTPVKQEAGQSWNAPTYKPRPELSRPIDYQPTLVTNGSHTHQEYHPGVTAHSALEHATPEYYEHLSQLPADHSAGHILSEAAVEVVDDDYYDVQSDEEMEDQTSALAAPDHRQQQRLHSILMANHFDGQNMQIRRYDTFLQNGMLDHYRVEEVANPLKNPATFRVFAHFISATGPSLSTFERHHVNSSVLFTQGSVPFSQQGLWTYTMPLAALRNQGLLHAMLALSSLHIARLQGASTTPSMQHYAWALKRIHKTVGTRSPQARLRVTTIAASMLLGFYEIMTADHMKWNTHLMGAKQLFIETDFAGMTRQFRRMKREKAERDRMYGRRNSISTHLNGHFDPLDQIEDIDENMVSHLVGRQVRYCDQGHVEVPMASMPPKLDLSKFEILKDLFWWYAKQDAYQSIVSGNNLLMDYSRWADCPPRAPLGRPDAVYGSFDHLVLLLGRIADFASKDRSRKLKQMEANGGQWRPAPGMNIPRPPQAPPTPASANGAMPHGLPPGPPPVQAGPAFFGMAPPPRQNVQMPSSYNPANSIPTPQSAQATDSIDMQLATQAALEEYGRIRAALREFANAISGEAFQSLGPDMQIPVETPFGPAKFYRSYDIGCMWAIYNMAIIIAIRSHPHMHPAAHAAAAIAAAETASYANEIGCIAAGIVPSPPDQPLNPSLGTALCESCMPSFFAAVQYQRPDQRYETVTRIFSIAQRTGWGSAELIANGCETAWVKAGIAGRGPPYERVINRPSPSQSDDPRLNGSWEKVDPNARVEDMDDGDRRLIGVKATASLNWAVGVMGMEEDVSKT